MDVVTGMQSGKTLFHDLQITLRDGKKFLYGKRIANRAMAEAIMDDILDVMTKNRNSDTEPENRPLVEVG